MWIMIIIVKYTLPSHFLGYFKTSDKPPNMKVLAAFVFHSCIPSNPDHCNGAKA